MVQASSRLDISSSQTEASWTALSTALSRALSNWRARWRKRGDVALSRGVGGLNSVKF